MHSVRCWILILVAISIVSVLPTPTWADDPAPLAANPDPTLRLSGQLNRALMSCDDGRKSAVYAIDNDTSSSRLGVVGKRRIPNELSAGFRVEIDSRITSSSEVSSGNPWGDRSGAIELRHAYGYVEDGKLGRLTFGQQ